MLGNGLEGMLATAATRQCRVSESYLKKYFCRNLTGVVIGNGSLDSGCVLQRPGTHV